MCLSAAFAVQVKMRHGTRDSRLRGSSSSSPHTAHRQRLRFRFECLLMTLVNKIKTIFYHHQQQQQQPKQQRRWQRDNKSQSQAPISRLRLGYALQYIGHRGVCVMPLQVICRGWASINHSLSCGCDAQQGKNKVFIYKCII